MKINWEGVMPAVTTKFTADDRLDLQMFKTNIEAQVEAGVNGIILGGTLGEASTLLPEEKRELTKYTKEIVGDRIPIIMNIAEQSTKGAIKASEIAEQDGVSGLMMLPPMRYNADERETVQYFKETARNTSLPIMIYNNPIDYKNEVTLDMLEELIKQDNIQAVKESTRDITNVTRIINRFDDRLKILCGVDTLAMESLVMGANGWVAGLVCAFPKETVAIYKLVKAGKIAEALKIYRWFLPVLELDIHTKLVQNIKLAEVATGIGTEHVRSPRLLLDGKERQNVQAILNQAMATRPKLEEDLCLIE